VPELESPDLDECRDGVHPDRERLVRTPVLRLSGKAMRLTGGGRRSNLETYGLDYRMSLAPRAEAARQGDAARAALGVPRTVATASPRSSSASTARPLAPQTDLLSRLGRAAAGEAAKGQVERLLGRKIFRAP
jgi:hypothetical protein